MVERICSLIKQKDLSVRAVEIALGWEMEVSKDLIHHHHPSTRYFRFPNT